MAEPHFIKRAIYKGELVESVPLPIDSPALLYGLGIFTTMRWEPECGLLLFEAHLARLEKSSQELGFRWSPDLESLLAAIRRLIRENGIKNRCAIRISLLAETPDRQIAELITTRPLKHSRLPIEEGLSARISTDPRTGDLKRHKSLNYADCLLASIAVQSAGEDEALFQDEQGNLTEGNSSNLFVISGDKLITPPTDAPILPGVGRQLLLDIGAESGLKPREASLSPEALWAADEALLTNSVNGIMPLVHVEGQPIGTGDTGTGDPGPKTRMLQAAWEKAARESAADSTASQNKA